MSENLHPGKSTNGRSNVSLQLEAVRLGLGLTSRLSTSVAARWAEDLFTVPQRFERPAREAAVLAGAEQELSIDFGGAKLAAWSWGPGPIEKRFFARQLWGREGETARTVLLVHGWAGRGSQLGAFVRPLVNAGARVVTFDGPAHGDSGGDSLTLPDFADAIRAVADAIGKVDALVAHSFGAPAVAIALERGLAARRVAFLAPAAAAEKATERFASLLRLRPEVRAAMERSLELRTGVSIADLDVPAHARWRTQPLLVVHDRSDAEVPWSEGAAIADAWPGARLLTTSGKGHRRLLWDEEIVAEVSAFVTAEARATEPS